MKKKKVTKQQVKKKRWSSTLLASLLLFLLNWGVWAYAVVVRQEWNLTPVANTLTMWSTSGQLTAARVGATMIAVFLIVLSLRIYLYLLLLEHDEALHAKLFPTGPGWLLRAELVLRCAAVVAVNFIYYAAALKRGSFEAALVATTLIVFVWDLLMMHRLVAIESLRGVHTRDGFLLVCALLYYFGSQGSGRQGVLDILLVGVTTAVGTTLFVSESSTYWSVIRRLASARDFGVPA